MSARKFFSSVLWQFLGGPYSIAADHGARGFDSYGWINSRTRFSGYAGGTSYPGILYNQQTVEQYLAILDMLGEVFMYSITGLSVRYIAEAILESRKDDFSVVTSLEDQELSAEITKEVIDYLNRINIKNIIPRILPELIYYGSYSFAIDEDFNLLNLYDPYSVISLLGENHSEVGYLVNTPSGVGFVFANESNIFRIGTPDIILYSRIFALDELYEEQVDLFEKSSPRVKNFSKFYKESSLFKKDAKNSYVRRFMFAAATPLFYYSRMRLREYIMKELILMLITIRDLLFPVVLTMQYDFAGTSFQIQNLADQIENILNSYIDIGGFIGVKANLSTVLNMITYSIRVLPDYRGAITNLSGIDTSKFIEKIDRYKSDLNELLENILSEIGIPTEGYTSKSTYWESIKQSERFASKIISIEKNIETSFSLLAEKYIKSKYRELSDANNFIHVNIFDTTIGNFSRFINAAEQISSFLNSAYEIISSSIEQMDNDYFNKEKLVEFIKSYTRYVVPDIDHLVDWNKLLKEKASSEEEGEDFEEDEGGLFQEMPEEETETEEE
ncbi:MAG: hypothetical protein NZZ41_07580, partial [Candidatus Dojkabacteria bacterium]|nr:hypothetical protein [Candidatus Dojkabacteria bacterium]